MHTDISILETIYYNKNEENQNCFYLIVYAIGDNWPVCIGEGILHKCLQSYAHLLPFDKKMHQNCFGDGYVGRRSF